MPEVSAATRAIRTSGAELANARVAWCSAIQYRSYPSRSATRASSIVLRSASAAVRPAGTGDWSMIDSLMPGNFVRAARGPAGRRRHGPRGRDLTITALGTDRSLLRARGQRRDRAAARAEGLARERSRAGQPPGLGAGGRPRRLIPRFANRLCEVALRHVPRQVRHNRATRAQIHGRVEHTADAPERVLNAGGARGAPDVVHADDGVGRTNVAPHRPHDVDEPAEVRLRGVMGHAQLLGRQVQGNALDTAHARQRPLEPRGRGSVTQSFDGKNHDIVAHGPTPPCTVPAASWYRTRVKAP